MDIIQPISPTSLPAALFDKSNPNIQVLLRVRPLNSKELQEGAHPCLFLDPQDPRKATLDCKPDQKVFYFDFVAGKEVTQEGLFEIAGRPLTEICIEGYNICIFAYGQTGAGKTYTMQGKFDRNEEIGLQPKVFEYLFELIGREKESEFSLKVTYLEIYNEQINDLLKTGNTELQVREDVKKGPYVEGLTEQKAENLGQMIEIMKKGLKNRHIGSTYMNIESSRSHSIFTINIESQKKVNNVINQKISKLNFVDLAGSERQKQSGTTGTRLKEAGNINKSLTILGCVINSLVESNHRKSRHIPYRDSKLTFILRDSLGGNSKTCMIAAVSAASTSFCETLSTLKFAQRAKMIRNRACVNEELTGNAEVLKLEIKRLKEELMKSQESIGNWKFIYEANEKELEKERFFWVLVKRSGEILRDLGEKRGSNEFPGEITERLNENGCLMREIEDFLKKILSERSEIRTFLEKNQTPSPKNAIVPLEKSQVFDEFPPDLDAFLKPFLSFSVSENEKRRLEALVNDSQHLREEYEIQQATYAYETEEFKKKLESFRIVENELNFLLHERTEEAKQKEEAFSAMKNELQLKIQEKIECLETLEREKVDFLAEIEELKNQFERIKGELEQKSINLENLLREKVDFLEEIEELKNQSITLKKEIEENKACCEALEREKVDFLAEIEDFKTQRENMKNELTEKENKCELLTNENQSLQAKSDAEALKMNDFLVAIKEKLRVRDQKIESLKKENDQKEEELLKTAINLQEILKGSEEHFKELRNMKEIKKENERLEKMMNDIKSEKERLEDLYKKLEYQANIMKANYKIKENEVRKMQEEKKLAELMSSKFEKQAKIMEEKVKGALGNGFSRNNEYEGIEKNALYSLKKENMELKNELIHQKEITESHRKKIEDLAKKSLLDPKKTLIQMDENIKMKNEIKELKQEKSEIYRLMLKLNKLCSEDNSDFLDMEENYEPAKLVNSLSSWISSLKERENQIFEKENQFELQEIRLNVIKEEYNLFVKKIELKKTEFSPHRLERFLEDYDKKNEERRKSEMWAKSEKLHHKKKGFNEDEYLSLPKKKIKMV